jgi:hypothetical protein
VWRVVPCGKRARRARRGLQTRRREYLCGSRHHLAGKSDPPMAIRIPVGTYQTISRGVVARDLNCPKWFSFATGAPVVRVDNLELRGLST